MTLAAIFFMLMGALSLFIGLFLPKKMNFDSDFAGYAIWVSLFWAFVCFIMAIKCLPGVV